MMKRVYIIWSAPSGINRRVATLRISGEWLNEIGFSIGKLITTSYENGCLVLRVHDRDAETYKSIYRDVFEKKLRLIQVGSKKRSRDSVPTFEIKGRWFEDLGFRVGAVVLARYEYGIIRIKLLDVDNMTADT